LSKMRETDDLISLSKMRETDDLISLSKMRETDDWEHSFTRRTRDRCSGISETRGKREEFHPAGQKGKYEAISEMLQSRAAAGGELE
jgi:hypothetical protein